jgi:hypothetical protein
MLVNLPNDDDMPEYLEVSSSFFRSTLSWTRVYHPKAYKDKYVEFPFQYI